MMERIAKFVLINYAVYCIVANDILSFTRLSPSNNFFLIVLLSARKATQVGL